MSGPLSEKEMSRIEDDNIIDKEIDTIFNETKQPHSLGEIYLLAERKGLLRHIDSRIFTTKILQKIREERAKQV